MCLDEQNSLSLPFFLYEIVHHCNLNCKWCDHCSPIADEEYVTVEQFTKDLELVNDKFSDVFFVAIMGGEPLMHPNLDLIIKSARNILPKSSIKIYTNGLLLSSFKKDFWHLLRQNKITIVLTKYDIPINYKKIEKLIKRNKVNLVYANQSNVNEKKFCSVKYDLTGKQDIQESYTNCHHKLFCTQLEDGKLYKCPMVPAVRHFNKYFNCNLEVSNGDYIDLTKDCSDSDISNYFKKPIPFCKYCNVSERKYDLKFDFSKKEISEWT